jgi:MATE family multidrug resistance protein
MAGSGFEAIQNFKEDKENPYWVLIQLAWPAILSQVSQTLFGLVDTIMMGKTGDVGALAASALANNILSVPIVFIVGMSYAATPKVAEYFATSDFSSCKKVLKQSILNNLFWCFWLCLFLWLLTPFARHLSIEKEVLDQAIPFFFLVIFSLPGIALFQSFRQFYDGLGRTKPGMVASLGANGLNIILNYLLIFGKFGFPEMGLMGAGVANLFSRWAMGIGLFLFFVTEKNSVIWREKFFSFNLDWPILKLLNGMGFPISFQFLFEVGAFSFTAILIGKMGAESLSAHQVVITMAGMTYMVASGISTAATVRVGHFVGLKNLPKIQESAIKSMVLTIAVMGITAFAFIYFRNQIPLLFINQTEVSVASSGLFFIAGIFQISDGLQVVGLGCLRGLSDVKIPTLITFLAYWAIAIPLGYWLGVQLHFGPEGTWWGLLIGLSVSAVFMLFRFFSIVKKGGLTANSFT